MSSSGENARSNLVKSSDFYSERPWSMDSYFTPERPWTSFPLPKRPYILTNCSLSGASTIPSDIVLAFTPLYHRVSTDIRFTPGQAITKRPFTFDRSSTFGIIQSEMILAFIVLCQNAQWARKSCLEIIYHLTTTIKITFQDFWAQAIIDSFLVLDLWCSSYECLFSNVAK